MGEQSMLIQLNSLSFQKRMAAGKLPLGSGPKGAPAPVICLRSGGEMVPGMG